MNRRLLLFTAGLFGMSGLNAIAATTTCSSVAACIMGTNSSSGPGAAGTSSSGFGLSGISKSNHGVNGTSSSSFGVVGITKENATSQKNARAGVLGEDESTNKKAFNSGLAGTSAYGNGVLGSSTYGIGVIGSSTYGTAGSFSSVHSDAIVADSEQCCGAGVYAHAYYGDGVYGNGGTGVAGDGYYYGVYGTGGVYSAYFTTNGGVALELADSSADGQLIEGSGAFSFDNHGNETLAGSLTQNGTPQFRTHSTTGTDVASYGDRTASPTIEDVGTAVLHDGVARVALDRIFASTIDTRSYYVFVTPHNDSNGLYAQSTPTGFIVRENRNGRSSLAFDYRIVAKPLDTSAARLPAMAKPRFNRARAVPKAPAAPLSLIRRSR